MKFAERRELDVFEIPHVAPTYRLDSLTRLSDVDGSSNGARESESLRRCA
ncbi:MAG: hypothetical protein JNK05_33065 [Myxococcales bacterium]|nr:hypothetical protein [Myxococcales bacterium]